MLLTARPLQPLDGDIIHEVMTVVRQLVDFFEHAMLLIQRLFELSFKYQVKHALMQLHLRNLDDQIVVDLVEDVSVEAVVHVL